MASTVLKVLRRLGLRDDPAASQTKAKSSSNKKSAKKGKARLGFTKSTSNLKNRTADELKRLGI